MKNTTHKSKYFCGNKISDYGLEHKRVDYGTLAKAFDAVLCNDITKLFYRNINNEYMEPEQVNGYIDNSDKIEELQEQIEELEEQDNQQEIYQYYIISDSGAELIKKYTNDPLYYIEYLDIYVWGVTHYGTSWDYVLTDIIIELDEV